MDYEKKYNEALKWMRELYPGLHGATKEDAEHFFPELRESEDERVIRTLYYLVRDHDWVNGATKGEALTWLEKQKEPKHAPDDLQNSFEAGQKSIVDNPEQYGLCKKAEWSKEDEEMRSLIVAIFEVNHPNGFFKANEIGTTDMRGVHTEEIISWLKSLRPGWKPTEEQMEALETAERWYSDNMGCNFALVSLCEQLKKLM